MNITLLPIDIKINILEYAGNNILLKVRDEDIINRIKIYDPSFGHNEWMELVTFRKEYMHMVNNSPEDMHIHER